MSYVEQARSDQDHERDQRQWGQVGRVGHARLWKGKPSGVGKGDLEIPFGEEGVSLLPLWPLGMRCVYVNGRVCVYG